MKRIYLDVAAAAPVLPVARRAFLRALRQVGNPSAMHEEGRAARALVEEARTLIARRTGVKAEHVTFTSGATEANTLAIKGYVEARRHAGPLQVMYHPGAHASVVEVMEALKGEGIEVTSVPTREGRVDVEVLATMLRPETALISLEAISPETGMRHDLRRVRTILDAYEKRHGTRIVLHVDGSQLPLVESVERTRLGADLLTLDAQKIGGVRGIGCLIRSGGIALTPQLRGGGQEGGLRSGTESGALAVSFAIALEERARTHASFASLAKELRTHMSTRIKTLITDVRVLGGKECAPHILTIALPGRDTDYLVALLDAAGFASSTKSACETDGEAGSRMAYLETKDEALAHSTLRISWDETITKRDLDRFVTALTKAVRFLDETAV